MKDGLLVVKETMPMEIQQVELIVVPREFSLSIMTLLHNEDHPSINQMIEVSKCRFFIFDRKEVSQEIYDRCLECMSRKKVSPFLLSLQTETKADCPGTHCNADVLARNKQKILLLRDNLTSYTLTKILKSELKEDLREGLIELTSFLKICKKTKIRVDPHPSFQALTHDKTLDDYGIELEIGNEKNINKNAVAEKAIQELEEELVRISPGNDPIDGKVLVNATNQLNGRIRHLHKSARELLFKRNQLSGEALEIDDIEVANKNMPVEKKITTEN
jgi:hypothetical protein